MNPSSKDIATVLDGVSSLGLTLGTDLFFSSMPNQPDDCVVVFDNPGGAPMLTYKKATSDYYYSSISVEIRNIDYSLGYGVAWGIFEYLHALSQVTVGTTYYALIKATRDPQFLHRDENDRAVFSLVFDVQRRDV